MNRFAIILAPALSVATTLPGGCARLAVEGGEKPIHIVMDINIKIDQKLDQFFAFADQPSPVAPATTRAAQNTGVESAAANRGAN